MGNLNHHNILWKDYTAELKQSRKFLECTVDNFLAQMIKKLTKGSALLDLRIVTNKELVRNLKARGSFGPREIVAFVILKRGNKAKQGSRRPGGFSRVTFSQTVNDPSQYVGNQVKVTGHPHGGTRIESGMY